MHFPHFQRVIRMVLTMLFASSVAWAQDYVLERSWSVAGSPGGIGVVEENVFFISNTDGGSIRKWTHGAGGEEVTTWTNPSDPSDVLTMVGGVSTGPRGITIDQFSNVLTLSNDTDHNVLVWDLNLQATTKRLKTSLNTGNDGRIYAIDNDGAGRLYIFQYFNVPAGSHRLEVYPPVSAWGTTHEETPLSSTAIDEPTPADAHEGMCVNAAGTVVWYTDRGGRAVHRMVGSPDTGYTEDLGFSLNLEDGSATAGFRAIALSADETQLFICDNRDQCIVVANSATGAIQQRFGSNLLGYDLSFDDQGSLYVSSYGTIGRVDKFRYVAPAGQIVDNSDVGCTLDGVWNTDRTESYGRDRYTSTAGSGANTATWTDSVEPGWYLVRFWMTANTSFATNARYSITHRDGTSVAVKNQQQSSSGWHILGGAYYFDGTATVALNDQFTGGSLVVADAIQFTPVFTMLQMSDSHVGYTRGTANTTAVANEMKTLGTIQMGGFGIEAPPPSFAIHSGDFTEYGQEYWGTLMGIFSGMPFPIYYVQGNHDSTWSSCKERIREIHGSPYYSFDHYIGGRRFHFACLNSPILQSPRAGFSREELDWLAADLAALEPDTPVFISIHHPINGASDPKPFDTYQLLETLRPYRLLFIFYGHGHAFVAPTFDHAQLLQGGSTYNNTTDIGSYAVLAITADRICVARKDQGTPNAATVILDYAIPPFPIYPEITVSEPAKDAVITSSTLSISASIDRVRSSATSASYEVNGDGNWRTLNGIGNGPYTGTLSLTSLVHGRHWIRVRFRTETGEDWFKTVNFWHWDERPSPDWIVDLGASSLSSPAVANGKVYVGTHGGAIRCVNAYTGSSVWTANLPGDVASSPAIADGKVVVGCGDGNVYCFNADTGAPVWTVPCGSPVYAPPTIDGNTVFVGSIGTGHAGSRNLYSIDLSTGGVNWAFPALNAIESKAFVLGDRVLFGAWDSYFYSVNKLTGAQQWRYQRNASRYYSPGDSWPVASAVANRVFVADREYYLNAINLSTGTADWTDTTVSSQVLTPDGLGLIQRKTGGALVRTDLNNATVWSAACALEAAPVSPVCAGDRVAVVNQHGLVSVVALSNGAIEYQFQIAHGYQLHPVNLDEQGDIYASTYEGFLMRISNSAAVNYWIQY